MADFAGGAIQAFAGPTELGATDNLEAVIIDFIQGAQKALDIAVQELDNKAIAQAILDARLRGVSVRMFMEQDYLKAEKHPALPDGATQEDKLAAQWHEQAEYGTRVNREILAALLRCGIDVKADLNPKIFHQKFIVRDYGVGAPDTTAVLTGSTNFTDTGTHANLNHIVIFHDSRVAKIYKQEFVELGEGTFGQMQQRRKRRTAIINLNGVPVRIRFAPDDAPELEVVKQMLKCSEELEFAIFTFSDSSGIDDALEVLKRAGINVRGAMDPAQGRQAWAAAHWLHDRGIKVYFPDPELMPGLGKLHHKLMVIDRDIVVGGSMNYTGPANELNDENIFVMGSPYDLPDDKGGPVDHGECNRLAGYFKAEIRRIIQNSQAYS